MFIAFTSFKHPKLPISIKFLSLYCNMTAISPNSSSWTTSLLTCLLPGCIAFLSTLYRLTESPLGCKPVRADKYHKCGLTCQSIQSLETMPQSQYIQERHCAIFKSIKHKIILTLTILKIDLSWFENSADPDQLIRIYTVFLLAWKYMLIIISGILHMDEGSYRPVWVKFKDFSRTSKSLSNSFNEKYWSKC